MTHRLNVRPEAESDMSEAYDWYESQHSGLGRDFVDEISACLHRIETDPQLYSKIHGELRRALVQRFPFGVFYIVEPEYVSIIAILHAARRPETWKTRV